MIPGVISSLLLQAACGTCFASYLAEWSRKARFLGKLTDFDKWPCNLTVDRSSLEQCAAFEQQPDEPREASRDNAFNVES
jgi:hypothetical protein